MSVCTCVWGGNIKCSGSILQGCSQQARIMHYCCLQVQPQLLQVEEGVCVGGPTSDSIFIFDVGPGASDAMSPAGRTAFCRDTHMCTPRPQGLKLPTHCNRDGLVVKSSTGPYPIPRTTSLMSTLYLHMLHITSSLLLQEGFPSCAGGATTSGKGQCRLA